MFTFLLRSSVIAIAFVAATAVTAPDFVTSAGASASRSNQCSQQARRYADRNTRRTTATGAAGGAAAAAGRGCESCRRETFPASASCHADARAMFCKAPARRRPAPPRCAAEPALAVHKNHPADTRLAKPPVLAFGKKSWAYKSVASKNFFESWQARQMMVL